MVKLLLEKGVELESKGKEYGWTPLSRAVNHGHEAMVKLLLEKGAELEVNKTVWCYGSLRNRQPQRHFQRLLSELGMCTTTLRHLRYRPCQPSSTFKTMPNNNQQS